MNNYIIYAHKNKINGKIYIGQTCQNPKKRWDNGRGYKTSPRFYNAIQKYGWENFEHIIIQDNLTLEEANIIEEKLIKLFKTTDENYGYNITSGGHNFTHSEETKAKIGSSNSVSLKGKIHTEEWKQQMSELFSGKGNPFYGKHHTDETKKKISENRKGKTAGEAHPFYGKHHTDETKNKISENRKGKGGRKVRCINTGEIFNSLGDAARWCGLKNCTGISQVCLKNGKQKTAGKHPITKEKLLWEYVEEINE